MGLINLDGIQSSYSSTLLTNTYINITSISMNKIPDVLGTFVVKALFYVYTSKNDRDANFSPIVTFERDYQYISMENPDIFDYCYTKLKLEYPNTQDV